MPVSRVGHRHYLSVKKNLHPLPWVIVTCVFFNQDILLGAKGLFFIFVSILEV